MAQQDGLRRELIKARDTRGPEHAGRCNRRVGAANGNRQRAQRYTSSAPRLRHHVWYGKERLRCSSLITGRWYLDVTVLGLYVGIGL